MSQTNTQKIIDEFNKLIDYEKVYTKTEFNNILTQAFKNIKNSKTKNTNGVKKPPTKYNLFIKENMGKLKQENPELNRQELMKLASEKWKIHKNNLENENKEEISENIVKKEEEEIKDDEKEEIKDDSNKNCEKDTEKKSEKKIPKKRQSTKKND